MAEPEHLQRLMSCLSPDQAEPDGLAGLSDAQWAGLVDVAEDLGLAPLLSHRLRTLGLDSALPAPDAGRLREGYLSCAMRNVRLSHQLALLLGEMAAADLDVILLKGMHLAETVYGNIALRPMIDFDLLVRREDLARAVDLLRGMGYDTENPFWVEAECEVNADMPGFQREGWPLLELHWTIERPTSPFAIDVDGLWDRAQPATVAGAQTRVLCPEDLLLHLCLHTCFHHRFDMRLRPIIDVAQTLAHYGERLDWPVVRARAEEWGASKCLGLTLHFAQKLLAAAVPQEHLAALQPEGLDPAVEAWAEREILGAGRMAGVPMTENIARVWHGTGLRGRLAHLFRYAFPPPKVMSTKYPAPPDSLRVYLYYPVRLRDLLAKYGGSVWQRLTGREQAAAATENARMGNALVDWLASR